MKTFRFAVLTPTGRSAVATIRLEGPATQAVVADSFLPATKRKRRADFRFGRWKLPSLPQNEEIVLRQLSGSDFEIHCHGGHAAVSAIRETLLAADGNEVSWQDWLQEQAENEHGIRSLSKLAWSRLPNATTQHTATLLLQQTQETWQRWFSVLQAAVDEADWPTIEEHIDRCLSLTQAGLHTMRPFRIVLAGRPNVGKSSLMNRLLGYDRSIVFDQPGTTRDVVKAQTAIEGWPIEFADTAGLRESLDALEVAGVERSRSHLGNADLILLVFEANRPQRDEEQQLITAYPHALQVYNKADLMDDSSVTPHRLLVSAHDGAGLALLLESIVRRLVPIRPEFGEPLPFCQEVLDWLEELQCTAKSKQARNFQQVFSRFTA